MDIAGIKNLILANLKSFFNFSLLWSRVKEAVKLPYAKTYIALSLFMTLVFIVVTFPYDMLIRNRLAAMEKTVMKTAHANEISAGLFDTITIGDLYLLLRTGSEISVRNSEIDLSLFRILFTRDIKGTVQLTGFRYTSDTSQVNLNCNGNVFLEFKTFSDLPRSGTVTAIVDNAVIKLGDLKLDSMGGLPLTLPPMMIKSMKIESEISGRTIRLKSIRLFGNDLNGSIAGSITIAKNFLNSRIDVVITLNPESAALTDYRDFLAQFTNSSNQIVLPLKGPLLNPRLDMGRVEAGEPPSGDNPIDQILPVP